MSGIGTSAVAGPAFTSPAAPIVLAPQPGMMTMTSASAPFKLEINTAMTAPGVNQLAMGNPTTGGGVLALPTQPAAMQSALTGPTALANPMTPTAAAQPAATSGEQIFQKVFGVPYDGPPNPNMDRMMQEMEANHAAGDEYPKVEDVKRLMADTVNYTPQQTEDLIKFFHAIDDQEKAREAAATANPGSSTEREALLDTVRGEIGVREDGDNTGARINDYRMSTRGYAGEGSPWCADFVSWAFNEHGKPLVDDNGDPWTVAIADWGKDQGRWSDAAATPRPGDLMFMKNPGGLNNYVNHVEMVERVDADGTIHTIGGNSSDQVKRNTHTSRDRIVGFVGADLP